jgi:outer membrane murein-binding lipoprotein Lpp
MKLAILVICSLILIGCSSDNTDVEPNIPIDPIQAGAEQEINAEVDTLKQDVTIHQVSLTDNGMSPDNLHIKVGETIVWTNQRTQNKAQIIGAQVCATIKSPLLGKGEKFNYTFQNRLRCNIIDSVFVGSFMVLKVG